MNQTIHEAIIRWLEIILIPSKVVYSVDISPEGNQYRINISTEQEAFFTQEHNQYLYSLQHILRTLVHKESPHDKTHFLLDVNNTRKIKEEKVLAAIPPKVERDVATLGRSLVITHLSSYERLLLRNLLGDTKGIELMSVGRDHSRKLLILPLSHIGAKGLDNAVIINSEEL